MKVSVVMAVYNAMLYLEETLLSALSQTTKDLEVIAVDDGSIDSSLGVPSQRHGFPSTSRGLAQQRRAGGCVKHRN